MTDPISEIQEAIEAAVGTIIQQHRGHLLGDFAFIASTMGTEEGDEGSYLTVFSNRASYHSMIGLATVLEQQVDAHYTLEG